MRACARARVCFITQHSSLWEDSISTTTYEMRKRIKTEALAKWILAWDESWNEKAMHHWRWVPHRRCLKTTHNTNKLRADLIFNRNLLFGLELKRLGEIVAVIRQLLRLGYYLLHTPSSQKRPKFHNNAKKLSMKTINIYHITSDVSRNAARTLWRRHVDAR